MRPSLVEYSKFLEYLGYKVYANKKNIFYNSKKYFFQQVFNYSDDKDQISNTKEIFSSISAIGIRYFSIKKNSDESEYGVYLAYPPYELSSISKKARNQVRRGKERVNVVNEKITNKLLEKAYPIYFDNLKRLQIFKDDKLILSKWRLWVNAIKNTKICEMWCAYKADEMVAFTLLVFTPWGPEIAMQRLNIMHSKLYPNNALVYSVAQSVFKRGFKSLSYGLNKFDGEKSGIDHFKVNMNFKFTGLNEHFIWNPWIAPFFKMFKNKIVQIKTLRRLLGRL